MKICKKSTPWVMALFLALSLGACGGGSGSSNSVANTGAGGDDASAGDNSSNDGSGDGTDGMDEDNTTPPPASSSSARFLSTAPSAATPAPEVAVSEALQYTSAAIQVMDGETGQTYMSDIEGQVRYPLAGDGPFPVVLYLHGRHVTCRYAGGFEFLSSGECPDTSPESGAPIEATAPIDSFEGYDYMAANLASHGYVVLSVDANDINDRDLVGDAGVMARVQVLLHHLDMFREINASGSYGRLGGPLGNPAQFSDLQGRIDFENIGIMGHSRGGQGVTQAITINQQAGRTTLEAGTPPVVLAEPFTAPHNLTAVFALAPTNFDYISAPDTTFAVLLPYCDGDVSNLQGAFMFDDSRFIDEDNPQPKFQIVTAGANHNYYNTMWTGENGDGDDYTNDDAFCQRGTEHSGRDEPADQRAHGEFLMSSFFRRFVGGEMQFAEYWLARAQLPADACPISDEDGVCDERVKLSIQAPAASRIFVENTTDATAVTTNDLAGNVTAEGFDRFEFCTTRSATGTVDPDGCPSVRTWSNIGQLFMQWSSTGAFYRSELGGLDVSEFDSLTLRVGVPINGNNTLATADQNFSVRLTDTDGNEASAIAGDFSDALILPPGDPQNDDNGGAEGAKTLLNMIQIPLGNFSGVNLSSLASVALVFDQIDAGALQITDLEFQKLDY